MAKLLASALGIVLLNPIACSGISGPGSGQDSGIGGSGTGGSTAINSCTTQADCAPNQICVQTMFPIMPPGGFGGSFANFTPPRECRDVGQGGATSTGGAASTGGSTADASSAGGKTAKPPVTGGATSRTPCNVATGSECSPNETCKQVIFPVMPPEGYGGGGGDLKLGECVPAEQSQNSPARELHPDAETWWHAAEAALRRS